MAVAASLMHALSQSAQADEVADAAPTLNLGIVFERVLDAVIVARLTTGRIVAWNPAAERLFGYSADEAIGQSLEILMPPAIAQVHRTGLARYVRSGHGLIIDADAPVEMPARTRTGEQIRIQMCLSEVPETNGERFALAIIRDASQRKQLELANLQLLQARVARTEVDAELTERDELVDSLAASLQSDPTPEELRRVGRTLADFREVRTGELDVRIVNADLVDIVHAAVDAARRHASGRRLLIHTPPVAAVSCDPARMRQALDQVLDETMRRTRDGARVELRLELVSPHLVQLTVTVEACGDRRPAGPGLQLGRALLRRQGGTFTVSTSSGGSLEVVMTLPGSPPPSRVRPARTRKPGRSVTASSQP